MAFVGRFGRPWRQPPPTQPFSATFDGGQNNAQLDATIADFTLATVVEVPRTLVLNETFGDFTLATVVDVPRTLTLTQTIAPFTLTARIGSTNNLRLDQTIEPFTLSASVSTDLNCPKFSEIAIAGAVGSSDIYPRC